MENNSVTKLVPLGSFSEIQCTVHYRWLERRRVCEVFDELFALLHSYTSYRFSTISGELARSICI